MTVDLSIFEEQVKLEGDRGTEPTEETREAAQAFLRNNFYRNAPDVAVSLPSGDTVTYYDLVSEIVIGILCGIYVYNEATGVVSRKQIH
jgi:hypothetical protein